MPRKTRVNILRLNVDATEAFVEEIAGERLLIIPTSVSGWRIGIGPLDVAALRVALDDYEADDDPAKVLDLMVALKESLAAARSSSTGETTDV